MRKSEPERARRQQERQQIRRQRYFDSLPSLLYRVHQSRTDSPLPDWPTLTPDNQQIWVLIAARVRFALEVAQWRGEARALSRRGCLPLPTLYPPDFEFTLVYKDTHFCLSTAALQQESRVFTILAQDCAESGSIQEDPRNSVRLPENSLFNEEHVAIFATWLRQPTVLPGCLTIDSVMGLAYLCEWVDAPRLRELLDEQIAGRSVDHPEVALQICIDLRYPKVSAQLTRWFIDSFLSRQNIVNKENIIKGQYSLLKKKFVDDAPAHWHKTMLECLLFELRCRHLGRGYIDIREYPCLQKATKQDECEHASVSLD